MAELSENVYKNLARMVMSAVEAVSYFNGKLELETPHYSLCLHLTLIIHRRPELDPADPSRSGKAITEIIPVWWDCTTQGSRGVEANDFSWRELNSYLTYGSR